VTIVAGKITVVLQFYNYAGALRRCECSILLLLLVSLCKRYCSGWSIQENSQYCYVGSSTDIAVHNTIHIGAAINVVSRRRMLVPALRIVVVAAHGP